MSKPMTLAELDTLLKLICTQNSAFSNRRLADGSYLPMVKYVSPNIDIRTRTCHSIVFHQGSHHEVIFHCQNECRDLPETLLERVTKYLSTPSYIPKEEAK